MVSLLLLIFFWTVAAFAYIEDEEREEDGVAGGRRWGWVTRSTKAAAAVTNDPNRLPVAFELPGNEAPVLLLLLLALGYAVG